MRRLPPAVWILAPLALGLLYAAGYALLAPRPTLGDLPPDDAILVHRIRGLDMLDLTSPGPRGPGLKAPREIVGQERNNIGLVGVDHEAPLHLVLLPRSLGLDASMAIFRLDDADAFEREFMRTDFLERGLIRRAQHLTIQHGYAAVGPNRDATRRLGTGGITAADLGEDWSMAADLPRLIDQALQLAKQYPWRGILSELGIDVDAGRMRLDPRTKAMRAFLPGDERVQRIQQSWKTVRLWAWHNQKKLRVDLEPTAGTALVEALTALSTTPSAAPPPPPTAQAWLAVPSGASRAALAKLLGASGLRFVEEQEGADPLGGLGAAAPTDGLVIWGERGLGTGYAMTVGLAGGIPDLSAFLPVPAGDATSAILPAGAAPITVGDTTIQRKVPAGTVERRKVRRAEVLTFGPSAKEAAEGYVSAAVAGTAKLPEVTPPWPVPAGARPVARFFLGQRRASMVLGRALQPGGFLAMLSGGDIHGRVDWIDGVVRLTAWVER
ncbi:MAG: hypothetical protein QNJ90_13305 [Planctomycetota bacterium]|nr:hypothetical protein [Planctomycetota bacterium]